MSQIKVLVVDDSALFRTLLRNALQDIPDCEVVGTASDGAAALEKIVALRPDLVTLDVEMGDMNGISVLRELKRLKVTSRVVMVSRLTSAGAQVTTDALLEGAFDFILKPFGKDPSANRAELKMALAEKIATIRDSFPTEHMSPIPNASKRESQEKLKSIDAVVIGSSTGGPDALSQVIPYLDPDFPVPIVIVQHMPENFTASLAMRLNEASEINVCEASDGLRLQPGMAVIAKGGKHLKLERLGTSHVVTRLTGDPHEHSCRPAVDYTFRSAVDVFGGHVLAVILTGMGRDGTEGCRLVREHSGQVIAQAAEGCVVYGMPKSVINAGQADWVIPLPKIANTIKTVIRSTKRANP